MLKSKINERIQEVVLPDFPDDDNTVPTVTKSRRVSFGTNFVKEFIVGSVVSGQCPTEYEQPFPSSDSSNADSSHSAVESGILEHSMFAHPQEIHKIDKPPMSQSVEPDFTESRPKLPKFSSTVCFSADSPTADMEFTEGCITLAKSILDKKNKEMRVIIQAKPKEPTEEEKGKDETKYLDGSQFEMSLTRCLKPKGNNKREEKRFESEKTKIFSKYENEMSITRCGRILKDDDSDGCWEDCKENRMPLDMIIRHLDKDNSDLENELFNPEKNFGDIFNADALDLTNESEKLNLNESMDISTDFQSRAQRSNVGAVDFTNEPEKLILNESMDICTDFQSRGTRSNVDALDFTCEPEMLNANKSMGAVGPRNNEDALDLTKEPEKLSVNKSMDISTDLQAKEPCNNTEVVDFTNEAEKVIVNKSMDISTNFHSRGPCNNISALDLTSEPEKLDVNKSMSTDSQSREPINNEDALNSTNEPEKLNANKSIGADFQSICEPPNNAGVLDLTNELEEVNMNKSIAAHFPSSEPVNNAEALDLANEIEKLNESKSMDVSTDIQSEEPCNLSQSAESPETPLVDMKVIESLKEQSKEAGCVWSLEDIRHPQPKTQGWLSFNCKLLDSSTGIHFGLKMTNEESLVACSVVTSCEVNLKEEKQLKLPEYRLVLDFGFDEFKKYLEERRTQVETIRHVPYFLDQINWFMVKMNSCLRQMYSVLTLYPGSRLEGSRLSFRLFSFPIFFSSTVSIDLSNYSRLSKSSLSFEVDFGSLDENKIREILEDCLKRENSLCEFIIQSTKYLVDRERELGCISKRGHIRLLPTELRL